MTARDPLEPHRPASPLELFFDLVFVVAVSFSSAQLHHLASEGHLLAGVGSYLMVFFAIWWAWMNFTWFATAFDTDDWLYRIATIVQMAGVLVLAAGTEAAMTRHDFTLVTIGYVVMRMALVGKWLRVASADPNVRATALRYASGITVVQIAWVVRLMLPAPWGLISFLVLVAAEITVPIWAERRGTTPWHPQHITERYGLFTLILLGESILASATSMVDALHHAEHLAPLLTIAAGGLVLAAGMWWIYFAREQHHHITTLRSSLTFGYSHYLIFAAAGAFSAGIEVAIDSVTGRTTLAPITAAATLTVPVAVFVLGIWSLTLRHTLTGVTAWIVPTLAVLASATAFVPPGLAIAAVLVTVIVVALETAALPPTRKGHPNGASEQR